MIGRDTLCGDPIFVDLNDRDIPVFTAMHGMGEWQETCISDTYEGFLKSLSKLEDESDRNLSDNDMMIVLKEIKNYIGDAHLEFWESIIRIKI
ncbi:MULTISPECIES: hypothetical protein [unclassified Microbulbifer]|uniref:hypothetical protein n=1 Tax=unclassified Microbulbifer TaxID=2619833 RepID=UPI0027E4168F|nr:MULTISPECIES: hypothetical protein [unclassified Microbulbifer]